MILNVRGHLFVGGYLLYLHKTKFIYIIMDKNHLYHY